MALLSLCLQDCTRIIHHLTQNVTRENWVQDYPTNHLNLMIFDELHTVLPYGLTMLNPAARLESLTDVAVRIRRAQNGTWECCVYQLACCILLFIDDKPKVSQSLFIVYCFVLFMGNYKVCSFFPPCLSDSSHRFRSDAFCPQHMKVNPRIVRA